MSIGEEHAHLAGYGGMLLEHFSSLLADDTSVYFTIDYNTNYLAVMAASAPAQQGRFSLGRLMKYVLASGETHLLAEENGGGAKLVGGRLYWDEGAPEPYSDLMGGRTAPSALRSVSIDGGAIVSPKHGATFAASPTHFYWAEGSTIFRKPLPDGPSTAVHYDVGRWGHFIESAGALYWVEPVPMPGADGGQAKGGTAPPADCRVLRLGVNDDSNTGAEWILIAGLVEPKKCLVRVDHESIYWQSTQCKMFMKLDASGARCVDVKLRPRYGQVFHDDVAYARADPTPVKALGGPTAIVQTPLSGPAAGREETAVSCDDTIPAFVVTSDRIVFECRRSLWSVSRPPSAPQSAPSVDAARDSASAGTHEPGPQRRQ